MAASKPRHTAASTPAGKDSVEPVVAIHRDELTVELDNLLDQ